MPGAITQLRPGPAGASRAHFLLLLILLLQAACLGHRPPPLQGAVVARIRFEGNAGLFKGMSDLRVRGAMDQEQNPPLTFVAPRRRSVPLEREVLRLDGWRIETWYAHHGHFEARFLGWDVITTRQAHGRHPARVMIVGHLWEGPKTKVERIDWNGVEVGGRPMALRLRHTALLSEGDTFDLDALHETELTTTDVLQENSFARATVQSSVEVDRGEKVARVDLDVDTGPPCRFGEIRLTGNYGLPKKLILDEIAFEPGQTFKGSKLAATRRQLYGLGVFSVVNVSQAPVSLDGDQQVVPIVIDLAEAKSRQLKVGGGFTIEAGRQDAHVNGEIKHVNLLNRLIRSTVGATVGYTSTGTLGELPAVLRGQSAVLAGPTLKTEVSWEVPHVPFPKSRWLTSVAYELGVKESYRFSSPQFQTGLSWHLLRPLTLSLGYRLSYLDVLELAGSSAPVACGDAISISEEGELDKYSTDCYFLSVMSADGVIDRRDDLIMPRTGTYEAFGVDLAGGPFGGDYSFLRFTTDQRAYVPIRKLLGWRPQGTLALRAGGGVIFPFKGYEFAGGKGVAQTPPREERLYLGGSNSIRGWRKDHLGPTEVVVLDNKDNQVPTGGLADLWVGAEVRLYTESDFGAVLFTEAGMVWAGPEEFNPLEILPVAGVGLRYKTSVGPLRADIGFWLHRKEPYLSNENRVPFGVHLALSEAY